MGDENWPGVFSHLVGEEIADLFAGELHLFFFEDHETGVFDSFPNVVEELGPVGLDDGEGAFESFGHFWWGF